jgi:hypothetical protein
VDPQQYLQHLWEQMQQQYRNYHASTSNSLGNALSQAASGARAVAQNNPFNSGAFQAMTTPGGMTSTGMSPSVTGGQYSNDLAGLFNGLLDKIKNLKNTPVPAPPSLPR